MNTKRDNSVHSVSKAFQLLEIMCKKGSPISLRELSEISGFPKSTVCTMLATMRNHNVVGQNSDGFYSLGMFLFECGTVVSSSWDINQFAGPYLQELADNTQTSSFLSVLDGNHVVSINTFRSHAGLLVIPEIGTKMPLHSTSQGKIFLSSMDDEAIALIMKRTGFVSYTPHTISDLPSLMKDIHSVRQNGYAIENGEYKVGLRSVSAPVYDLSGSIRYAVGVVGLLGKPVSDEFQNVIQCVLKTATMLSRESGFKE